ncbi:hypothetical protein PS2_003 [Serratia phage PS2]|uniref:Uncharacterized protein n=1 Tax=Serratia phage PS2 TaxID=1481112 RepID=A0A023W4U4_9CAUD|nr:hypothetical protein FF83_gp003 [Serratia phage PS2]AHY25255.1 hypothetical protein PS2_003 [Serratia phage PS2]
MINFAIKNFSTRNTFATRQISKAVKALSFYERKFKDLKVNFYITQGRLHYRVAFGSYDTLINDSTLMNLPFENLSETICYWMANTIIAAEHAAKWEYAKRLSPETTLHDYMDEAADVNIFLPKIEHTPAMTDLSSSWEKWDCQLGYDWYMARVQEDEGITSTTTAIINAIKAIR